MNRHNQASLFFILLSQVVFSEEIKTYSIGGIFDQNAEDEKVFNFAVDLANTHQSSFAFAPLTTILNTGGPFEALNVACSYLNEKSIALFGPKAFDNVNTIQSLCDDKDIPHFITRFVNNPLAYSNTINFYPHSKILSQAYIDIVSTFGWKSFTVLYEDNESLLRLADLITTSKKNGKIVTIKKLDEAGDEIYRTTWRDVRASGEINFVIDCKVEVLYEVLKHAQQIGLMTSEYRYFITNLDLQTIDIEPFQFCEANITSIRIVDPTAITQKLDSFSELLRKHEFPPAEELKTETALLIDAVTVFSKATEEVRSIENFDIKEVFCNTSNSFMFGTTLINFIKGIEFIGFTGLTKLDHRGFRSVFNLDVIELVEEGISKIGTWNSTKGLIINRATGNDYEEDSDSLRNKTFIVITCLTDPYGMLKESEHPLHGNNRYEGFGIDLIYELAQMEGFNYTFIIREDKKNGAKDPVTGKWSGMIGDLIDYRADLAITDLTITAEREEAVDFTSPFMNLGISILAKKPGKAPPSFFSFADPFAIDTWAMLALGYVVVSISLFILGRLCPDEWTNPYPCIEEPEFLINQFSLMNSLWFTTGSLMQQGTEIAPTGIATRMIAGMWWFFVLIMVSSYTANLAAFLTTENPIELFQDVHSLAENTEKFGIRMGAKAGGATASFFKDKESAAYKVIADYMEAHEEDMVKENKDGVALAENSTYAFFMESTSIEYETQRHCNLQMYGNLLDDKGYGIAMRKNSTYRKKLSMAILKLQASGEIDKIKRRWWEERKGGGQCSGDLDGQEATPLNLENVEGVFYVTVFGTISSMFCVILEMLLFTIKLSIKTKTPFKEVLKCEMRAYFNFNSNVKPVIGNEKSDSGSPKDSLNNQLKPESYGFISAVSKEHLTNNES